MNNLKLKNWKSVILIFGLLLVVISEFGCVEKVSSKEVPEKTLPEQEETPVPLGDKPSAPMIVNLSMIGTPLLNQPVDLIFTVMPLVDAPDTVVDIQLPTGFSLVSGDLSWKGNISKNEVFQLNATVKSVETGYWTIEASARSMKFGFGKTDKLFTNISETTASVSESPLQIYSRSNKTMTAQLPPNLITPSVNETSDENISTPSPTQHIDTNK